MIRRDWVQGRNDHANEGNVMCTINRVLALSVMVFVSACATDSSQSGHSIPIELASDPRVGEKVDDVCFPGRTDQVSGIGRQALIFRKGRGEEYIVFTGYCQNASAVRLVSTAFGCRRRDSSGQCAERPLDERTCPVEGREMLVFSSLFPTEREFTARTTRCRVLGIYRWNESAIGSEREEVVAQE